MFEFAIRTTLRRFDLDTAEGQVQALRAAAPVVAGIRDTALRPEYARRLAGWLGMEIEPVVRAVQQAGRVRAGGVGQDGQGGHGEASRSGTGHGRSRSGGAPDAASAARPGPPAFRIDPRDPVARVEREALECLLQFPQLVPQADADALGPEAFEVPAYRGVHHAVRAAGGIVTAVAMTPVAWAEAVREAAPDAVANLVTELAVAPLPVPEVGEALEWYAVSLILRVAEFQVTRQIGSLKSRVQRLEADDPTYQQAFADLLRAEALRRGLRDRLAG